MRKLLLAALTLLALPAFAQSDDAPIPYDDTPTRESTPEQSEPTPALKEDPLQKEDRDRDLAKYDDPATGLGGEVVAGLMLLDSTRGSGTDGKLAFGARFSWDIGRMFSNEVVHDALFADLTFLHSALHDGTVAVYDDTSFNNITIAPAWELTFGQGSAFGAYAQLGFGASMWSSTFAVNNGQTPVSGIKPLIQYGIGLRGRPLIGGDDSKLRLTFRVELMRFRRSYLNDTFLGGSLGLAY